MELGRTGVMIALLLKSYPVAYGASSISERRRHGPRSANWRGSACLCGSAPWPIPSLWRVPRRSLGCVPASQLLTALTGADEGTNHIDRLGSAACTVKCRRSFRLALLHDRGVTAARLELGSSLFRFRR